ncbi:ion transporter [Nocardioides limicola]|uniref:ion transporter n=1 Tax=Nocardioides limicola TaxID=2803368 RepID=UPI00193B94F5|nr:ion transporter [Nocardioides sp. DJM-14]
MPKIDTNRRRLAWATERQRLAELLESNPVQRFVIVVILANAVILGLDTSEAARRSFGDLLGALDTVCLTIFVIELALKLFANGPRFFLGGWNVFDFVVVAIALVPASGSLSVLRTLRVLRVLRLISAFPKLRFVVEALVRSLPGLVSIGGLLVLVFYVAAVTATNLFGQSHPQWFGDIGKSLYSLFQVMTLESWSMGIARPVMTEHPWAWAFFVPFILISAFMVLNLFMAVIVDSMQQLRANPESWPEESPAEVADAAIQAQLTEMAAQLADVQSALSEATQLLRDRQS